MRYTTRRRVLSYDQAEKMVGQKVPAMEPTPLLSNVPITIRDEETGKPVLIVTRLEDAARYRQAVLKIEMQTINRAKNYGSRSRTFGFRPRRPTHYRESCGITNLGSERPDIEAVLEAYADQFSAVLDQVDPDIRVGDTATLAEVKPEWRFGEAKLWTSGVVNDTAQLPYHRDRFNFSTWSAMPVIRRGTRGGHLHLPEYDLVIPCADSTVIFFPGYQYLHGVTPIRRIVPGQGYRISVVYYALQGMKSCLEYAVEAKQGLVKRTERETDMAKRLAAGERGIPGK